MTPLFALTTTTIGVIGLLIVVGGWGLASVFDALSYLLPSTIPHPVDALFESASGFTTAGASKGNDSTLVDWSLPR